MLAVSVFVIAEVGDHEVAVAPVFLDADPGLQKDLRAHEALTVLAGVSADLFEHLAVFADNDALVAGLFAVDRRVEVDDAVIPLGEFRDLDRGPMRDLLSRMISAMTCFSGISVEIPSGNMNGPSCAKPSQTCMRLSSPSCHLALMGMTSTKSIRSL